MKISYDNRSNVPYIMFADKNPDGVTEAGKEINIDSSPDGKLTGIEIRFASKQIDTGAIFAYSIGYDNEFFYKSVFS